MAHQYKDRGLWGHIRREQIQDEFTNSEEIADVIAYLASDQVSCINGYIIYVSDGFENFKYPSKLG